MTQSPDADTTSRVEALEEVSDKAVSTVCDTIQKAADGIVHYRKRSRRWKKAQLAQVRRVLIVDDNADALSMFARLVERDKHEVHRAKSGEEALTLARSIGYDLVILDLNLGPGLLGQEVAQGIRARSFKPLVPIVIVSGLPGKEVADAARLCGASAWMSKPVDVDRFYGIVRRLLRTA